LRKKTRILERGREKKIGGVEAGWKRKKRGVLKASKGEKRDVKMGGHKTF